MPIPSPSTIVDTLHCTATIDSTLPNESVDDLPKKISEALNHPIDFPAWASAIVPGDHVVLAVNPSVPCLAEVISAIRNVASEADAGQIDVVLWDEATSETVEMVKQELPETSRVVRHRGESRRDVRYLAADASADAVYLNRLLVDADLVLPVTVANANQINSGDDLTGIFPMLSDSASRLRDQKKQEKAARDQTDDPAWLLGVQVSLLIVPNQSGGVANVIAGTTMDLQKELEKQMSKATQPYADLVVALMTGDASHQTWHNAVRSIVASIGDTDNDPTIVLWTEIDHPIGSVSPVGRDEMPGDDEMTGEDQMPHADEAFDSSGSADSDDSLGDVEIDPPTASADEDFPAWNPSDEPVAFLKSIEADRRVFVRCDLASEALEAAGLAAIASRDELARLSEGFDHARVIPAAQFMASATLPVPHPIVDRQQ